MKVISGFLKGRDILGFNIEGTRPTMNRVKESLFAMIQDNVKESIVLDLFAGSGSLGIEAISNYSKKCYFVDNNREVIKILNKNINNFKIQDKSVIMHSDYNNALIKFKNNQKFDLVFLDPPYQFEVIDEILSKLVNYNLLNNNSLVIVECQKTINKDYDNLDLIKEKKYSDKYRYIYRYNNKETI